MGWQFGVEYIDFLDAHCLTASHNRRYIVGIEDILQHHREVVLAVVENLFDFMGAFGGQFLDFGLLIVDCR